MLNERRTCGACGRSYWVDEFTQCICGRFLPATRHVSKSHLAWDALHRYASFPWNPAEAERWYYDHWLPMVPEGQCGCQENWRALTNRFSPVFTSRETFFRWTFEAHNLVREKLQQQPFQWADALVKYGISTEGKTSVGFLFAAHSMIGGTETWCRTIIPRLRGVHVEGMAVTAFYDGDQIERCSVTYGPEAAIALSRRCNVMVVWGVENYRQYIDGTPRVIGMHHGDATSEWSLMQAMQGFDQVVAINPHVAALNGFVYIPNAVDPARVGPRKPIAKPGNRVAIWCARYSPEKRPQLFVDAARLLPDWTFVMIGSGPIPVVDVPANVIQTGALSDQADWLAMADVFVSLAEHEGFGLSMAEAMLAGVPVVATPCGLGNDTKLVSQLSKFPAADEVAASIVAIDCSRVDYARQFIKAHHDVDLIVDKWERLLGGSKAKL